MTASSQTTPPAPSAPMQIDFVADVVCPWCYLGWERLKKALALRPDVRAQVLWRPFQLDPMIPEQGVDRKAYMANKFKDPERIKAAMAALQAGALEDGVILNLADIPISPNTNAAHRVIRWAQRAGCDIAVIEGIMKAYFTDLRDIGDPEVLADIADKAGLERMAVLKMLSEDTDRDVIANEHGIAVRAGITGVPFTIFDGKVAASGAESPERLVLAIDQALATPAA